GTAAADPKRVPEPGASPMAVAIGGAVRAMLVLADVVREDAAATLRRLRGLGVRRAVLVTGDRADVATVIAGNLGLDAWTADATPAGKVRIVAAERQRGITMMVGDGINDAAALAGAHVGVALGPRGTAAASEAADVVILVDRFDHVADAVALAQDTRSIALQSVFAGMALSVLGMIVAALGYLPAIAGALAQELIDIAVVLNALRALRPAAGTHAAAAAAAAGASPAPAKAN